jgi:glucokinase
MTAALSLVADIGATNARFGLLDDQGRIVYSQILPCAGYPTLELAAAAYLDAAAPDARPRRGALAIAGPVTGDVIVMTNHPWTFSVTATCAALGLDRLEVVNDFTAVAMAVPVLAAADRRQIGDGTPVPDAVIGILGAGTGLGVSGLVPGIKGWTALAGEGGHVTMAPVSDRESAVLAELRRRFGHVSAERVLSGQGLVNLHEALSRLEGCEPNTMTPANIADAGLKGADAVCVETLDMFCAMLGTVAGNLALTLGARGGVYVGGGIVPKLGPYFAASPFRAAFEAKGRFRDYLQDVPTFVIRAEDPALLGAARALEQG